MANPSNSSESGLSYLTGFGNAFQSEALEGALPAAQNSPLEVPYGLVAEQLNGTPFTVRRQENRRTWMYRVRPQAVQSELSLMPEDGLFTGRFAHLPPDPNLRRWRAHDPDASKPADFVEGLRTMAGTGDPELGQGLAVHVWAATKSMGDRALYNGDGEMLLAPWKGTHRIRTEMGRLDVSPGEIAVIPRGVKFSVDLAEEGAGFVLELFDGALRLPERGLIGANGLADERHFEVPTAWYEDREVEGGFEVIMKSSGRLFRGTQSHSPYDVVAWHGDHVPYRYDLRKFNAYGSVSFDHADPSILTVLTCPAGDHGRSAADVVIFGGRWDVAEHTYRPPYYHRNAATELTGIISNPGGEASGFVDGGMFLTPPLTPHGVGARVHKRELARAGKGEPDKAVRMSDRSLWLMFESAYTLRLTEWARAAPHHDDDFGKLWDDLPVTFDPSKR